MTSKMDDQIHGILDDINHDRRLEETVSMIEQMPDVDILNVRDGDNHNLLQCAARKNRLDVVMTLVNVRGYHPHSDETDTALQIACLYGHYTLAEFILSEKRVKANVGFYLQRFYSPDNKRESSQIKNQKFTPAQCAILGDHDDVLKLIEEPPLVYHGYSENEHNSDMVNFACKHGAIKCIDYLVAKVKGLKISQEAVMSAAQYGTDALSPFVKHGIDFIADCTSGKTLLITYLNENRECKAKNASVLKYLLQHGLQSCINNVDDRGNAPMHQLIYNIVGSCHGDIEVLHDGTNKELGNKYASSDMVQAILDCNPDLSLINGESLTPVTVAFEVFDGVTYDCFYVFNPDIFHEMLSVLLSRGYVVTTVCDRMTFSAIHSLMHAFEHMYCHELPANNCDKFVDSLRLLLDHCEQPVFHNNDHTQYMMLIVDVAESYLRIRGSTPITDADFVDKILTVFLEAGLNPNLFTDDQNAILNGRDGNGLNEFSRLFKECSRDESYEHICTWQAILVQYGADPGIKQRS